MTIAAICWAISVPAEAAAPERGGKEWRYERRFWEGVFMKIFPQRFTSHV